MSTDVELFETAAAVSLPDSPLLPRDLDITHLIAEANFAAAMGVEDIAAYLRARYERDGVSAVGLGRDYDHMIVTIGGRQHDVRWSRLSLVWYARVSGPAVPVSRSVPGGGE